MIKVVSPIFFRHHQAISQFHERNIKSVLFSARRQSSHRLRREISSTSPTTGSRNDVVTGSLSGAKDLTSLLPPAYSGGASAPGRNAREARLLVSGPDATGIVASFSQLLYRHGCGIVDCASESSQRDDAGGGPPSSERKFFQRILFDHGELSVERGVVEREVDALCATFGMESQVVSCSVSLPLPTSMTPQRFNSSAGATGDARWLSSLASTTTASGNCS